MNAPVGDPALINDVIAAVDVKCLAGDQPSRIVSEERGGNAHVVDADEFRAGAFAFALSSRVSNSGMPEAARVASGPGEIACTRMPLGPTHAPMQSRREVRLPANTSFHQP